MKPKSFLFLMDPFETLNLETETSLLLMGELIGRGHEVYWAETSDLILRQDKVFVHASQVDATEPFHKCLTEEVRIDDFDSLLVRTDPPFDERFLHLTYLLDFVDARVVQFNPVTALRNFNEKLTTLRFPHLAPPTLTTQNESALLAFLEEHGDIVTKPLSDCSGRGIQRFRTGDRDSLKIALKDEHGNPRFLTAQKFLEDIQDGDKRIYLVGGEPVGFVNRIPAAGEWLGNIHQGAQCVATDLTPSDLKIISEIRPFLLEHGIFLVGLDIIGDRITEINITSPSAIRQINEVMGRDIHKIIIDRMLERVEEETSLVSFPARRQAD